MTNDEPVVQLSIPNFPASMLNQLEAEARRQDRSRASLMRQILANYLAEVAGITAKPAARPQQ